MFYISRLYSCLANGSADEFQKGDHLFKGKAVKEALQIGRYFSWTPLWTFYVVYMVWLTQTHTHTYFFWQEY